MHRNLTPGVQNKFLRLGLGAALILVAASAAMAQNTLNLSDYQGPGILSRSVCDVGSRGGEQLDLRYYAGVSGVVNTNIQPFSLDAHGNLLPPQNAYGIEVSGGAYGVHSWKRSQLGLDYSGTYRHYFNQDAFNGSDQHLSIGLFTSSSSRRSIVRLA